MGPFFRAGVADPLRPQVKFQAKSLIFTFSTSAWQRDSPVIFYLFDKLFPGEKGNKNRYFVSLKNKK